MSDVMSIQEQARRSFFQWHVFLMLKKKQLEATLADAGYRPQAVAAIESDLPPVFDSDELALLKHMGLPIPDNLADYDLPNPEQPTGVRFFFLSSPAFDSEHDAVLGFVRQVSSGAYEHRELMRVELSDKDYLDAATSRFNQALTANAVSLVLNAAFIWSLFHGAVILDWVSVSSRVLGVAAVTAATAAEFQGNVELSEPDNNKKTRRRVSRKGRGLFGDST